MNRKFDPKQHLAYIDREVVDKQFKYLMFDEKVEVPMNSYMEAKAIIANACKDVLNAKKDEENVLQAYFYEKTNRFLDFIGTKINEDDGSNFIINLDKLIVNFKIFLYNFDNLFKSLPKLQHIKRENPLSTIIINLFKEKIMTPTTCNKIFISINNELEKDRQNKLVNRDVIKNILLFLCQIDYYYHDIKKIDGGYEILLFNYDDKDNSLNPNPNKGKSIATFTNWYLTQLISLEKFIKDYSANLINLSAPEYISEALKYLDEENLRKTMYIPKDGHKKIDEMNYKYLIDLKVEIIKLKPSGFESMFNNNKKSELLDAFKLFSKLPSSLDHLIKSLSLYIKNKGSELAQNTEVNKDPEKFIIKLIEMKKDIDSLVEVCFESHVRFIDGKNKAFSSFMSKDESFPIFLCIYTDIYMRYRIKGKNDSQIEDDFNDIISILRCLSNKILFLNRYNKLLSSRILNKSTANLSAEKTLVTKLRSELGNQLVQKMTSIFEDMDKSEQMEFEFNSRDHRGEIGGVKFNCKMLQNSSWELSEEAEFSFKIDKISPKLAACMNEWKNFYSKIQTSHKISWVFGAVSSSFNYFRVV